MKVRRIVIEQFTRRSQISAVVWSFPSWDRRGSEPRNEASGVVLQKRERSEPPLKPRDSASLRFIRSASRKYKEARCARISVVPPRSPRASARYPSYPRRGIRFPQISSVAHNPALNLIFRNLHSYAFPRREFACPLLSARIHTAFSTLVAN